MRCEFLVHITSPQGTVGVPTYLKTFKLEAILRWLRRYTFLAAVNAIEWYLKCRQQKNIGQYVCNSQLTIQNFCFIVIYKVCKTCKPIIEYSFTHAYFSRK